jgi:hypothetical protein
MVRFCFFFLYIYIYFYCVLFFFFLCLFLSCGLILGVSVEEYIAGDTSGDYKEYLLALAGVCFLLLLLSLSLLLPSFPFLYQLTCIRRRVETVTVHRFRTRKPRKMLKNYSALVRAPSERMRKCSYKSLVRY